MSKAIDIDVLKSVDLHVFFEQVHPNVLNCHVEFSSFSSILFRTGYFHLLSPSRDSQVKDDGSCTFGNWAFPLSRSLLLLSPTSPRKSHFSPFSARNKINKCRSGSKFALCQIEFATQLGHRGPSCLRFGDVPIFVLISHRTIADQDMIENRRCWRK